MAEQNKVEFRLVDLETRIAYQDENLEQLNGVVIQQQQEIDEIKMALMKLAGDIKSIQNEKTDPSDEPPPPHY